MYGRVDLSKVEYKLDADIYIISQHYKKQLRYSMHIANIKILKVYIHYIKMISIYMIGIVCMKMAN